MLRVMVLPKQIKDNLNNVLEGELNTSLHTIDEQDRERLEQARFQQQQRNSSTYTHTPIH